MELTVIDTTIHTDGTRNRLVECAIGLLSSEPYTAVGVAALCSAAGVRKGSFYHFFSSKEDLTLSALDRCWEQFRREVLEPIVERETDSVRRCEAIWDACVTSNGSGKATIRTDAKLIGKLAAGVTENEPRLRQRVADVFNEWVDVLGGDEVCWSSLADVQGRLVLAATLSNGEVLSA